MAMRFFRRTVKPAAKSDTQAAQCPKCGGTAFKRVLATHPVPLSGKLAGRRLDIYRVEMNKCRQCGAQTPTAEGAAKIERCTKKGIEIFLKHIR